MQILSALIKLPKIEQGRVAPLSLPRSPRLVSPYAQESVEIHANGSQTGGHFSESISLFQHEHMGQLTHFLAISLLPTTI
jgi:hypothetical protein